MQFFFEEGNKRDVVLFLLVMAVIGLGLFAVLTKSNYAPLAVAGAACITLFCIFVAGYTPTREDMLYSRNRDYIEQTIQFKRTPDSQ